MASRVKICGLTRPIDIDAVNHLMPDYIGFVFAPSKRQVTAEQAIKLRQCLHSGIKAVGVFVNTDIEQIAVLVQDGVIDIVQLHGNESELYISMLKASISAPIIKAIAVNTLGDAQRWDNSAADYLLLDNGAGGTGQTFDWAQIGKLNKPFFLAGGIDCGNVNDAVKQVAPYAVDVSSGVETDGVKDYDKIKTFINTVRNGDTT